MTISDQWIKDFHDENNGQRAVTTTLRPSLELRVTPREETSIGNRLHQCDKMAEITPSHVVHHCVCGRGQRSEGRAREDSSIRGHSRRMGSVPRRGKM